MGLPMGRTMQEDVYKVIAALSEVRQIGQGLEIRGDLHMKRIEWLEARVAELTALVMDLAEKTYE